MRNLIVAGVLTLSGFVTTGVGLGKADEIQVEGSYASQDDCTADGLDVQVVNGGNWTHFECVQHSDGLWYLYLSN